MGKKLEPRPLPAGWKAFKLPCANNVAYQNPEYKCMEFDYHRVCNPNYPYPKKKEKTGPNSGFHLYLEENKAPDKKMSVVAGGWKLLSADEQKSYNDRVKRMKEARSAQGAAAPADAKAKAVSGEGKQRESPKAKAKAKPAASVSGSSDDGSVSGSSSDDDDDAPAPKRKRVE